MPVQYKNGLGRRSGRRRKLVRDLTGEHFGRLVVTRREDTAPGVVWRCRCDCGGLKLVATGNLTRGHVRSCGCRSREVRGKGNQVHGHCRSGFRSPLWRRWCRVRDPDKGGCCKRWLRGSFMTFLGDVRKAIGEPLEGSWLVRPNTRRMWSASNIQWMLSDDAMRRKHPRRKRGKRRAWRGGAR